MNTKVECYAGSTSPESPRTLEWEGQHFTVETILARRREPLGVGFLVCCQPDDTLFDLFYLIEEESWQIQPKGPAHDDQPTLNPKEQGE
jgi:hypothetical protein